MSLHVPMSPSPALGALCLSTCTLVVSSWSAGLEVPHPRESGAGACSQLGIPAGPIRQVTAQPRAPAGAFPRWSDGSLLNFVSWAPGKPRPINRDKKCVYMTASRGEGPDPAMGCMETPLPQVSREGHAWPLPPCRGLGGPEVHDGAALHLQAEQRDGHEAFPPTTACSRQRGLPPRLVSLPQQGTAGWRGAGRPLASPQPCRGGEGAAEEPQGGGGCVPVFWGSAGGCMCRDAREIFHGGGCRRGWGGSRREGAKGRKECWGRMGLQRVREWGGCRAQGWAGSGCTHWTIPRPSPCSVSASAATAKPR